MALTSIQLRFQAAVALQGMHLFQCLQSCTCTCCCNLCNSCTCCRHTAPSAGSPGCSSAPPPPRSRSLVKKEEMWSKGPKDHLLKGFCTENMAFTASLWQVWRSTFCSRSTLPRALLSPRPPGHKIYIFVEMLSIKVLRTSLASPEQNHKGCLVSVATAPSQHLSQFPWVLWQPWPKSLITLQLVGNWPMHTVSLMSGISQPIPEHLVLISSLQSLGVRYERKILLLLLFTQFSGQSLPSPSQS